MIGASPLLEMLAFGYAAGMLTWYWMADSWPMRHSMAQYAAGVDARDDARWQLRHHCRAVGLNAAVRAGWGTP